MNSKTALNGIFGMIAILGLALLGCDTETAWQLFGVVLAGFALILIGGRGLILNNR